VKNEIEKQGYYVPDISEFHIGFRYQYSWGGRRWSNQVYTQGNNLEQMKEYLENGNIRVELKEKAA